MIELSDENEVINQNSPFLYLYGSDLDKGSALFYKYELNSKKLELLVEKKGWGYLHHFTLYEIKGEGAINFFVNE